MFSIFKPMNQPSILMILLLLFYVVFPLFLYWIGNDFVHLQGVIIGLIGCIGCAFGIFFATVLGRLRLDALKIFPSGLYIHSLTIFFLFFIILTVASAKSLPLIEALSGASAESVSVSRELFLKGRSGWQVVLVYVNAVLSGALLPFALVLSFSEKRPIRWILLCVFFCYSIIFLEKAFFLRCLLPLLSFYSVRIMRPKLYLQFLLLSIVPFMLFFNTIISGFGMSGEIIQKTSFYEFFSADYSSFANSGPIKFLFWRILAVPVFTFIDSFRVFNIQVGSDYLLGATSSFFSILFDLERIKFERIVFESQWGQTLTGTGSANSVFFVEAFVNFGYLGVLLFGIIVGFISKKISDSKLVALSSLSILFSFSVFAGGLIGVLLSNGYLFLFLMIFLVKPRIESNECFNKSNN